VRRNIFFLTLIFLGHLNFSMSAVREYQGRDSFSLKEGQHLVIDALDMEINAYGADIPILRCLSNIKISGAGAAKADAWITAHIPQFENTPEALEIRFTPTKTGFLGLGMMTQRKKLSLIIPLHVIPEITTSSGNIILKGDFAQANPLRFQSGKGNIQFTGAASAMEIRSTSGSADIQVFRPLGKFWARTASGSISLEGGSRDLHIETASGKLEIRGLLASASVETVSGDVEIQWDAVDPNSVIKIRSASGLLRIILPPNLNPGGSITTTTGNIRSEFPGEALEDSSGVRLGGDGPVLDIESASGDILLLKDQL